LRSAACAGNHQNAGGVAVEPVHEPGFLALLVAPRLKHLVNIAGDAGAALHGKAGGLVEHQHLVVLMQQHLAQHIVVVAVLYGVGGERPGGFFVDVHRRHSDGLAGVHPAVGLDPAAIDADLPGSEQLLQLREAETGKMRLEPAIEPHARFLRIYLYELYARHIDYLFNLGNWNWGNQSWRASQSPPNNARMETVTLAIT